MMRWLIAICMLSFSYHCCAMGVGLTVEQAVGLQNLLTRVELVASIERRTRDERVLTRAVELLEAQDTQGLQALYDILVQLEQVEVQESALVRSGRQPGACCNVQ